MAIDYAKETDWEGDVGVADNPHSVWGEYQTKVRDTARELLTYKTTLDILETKVYAKLRRTGIGPAIIRTTYEKRVSDIQDCMKFLKAHPAYDDPDLRKNAEQEARNDWKKEHVDAAIVVLKAWRERPADWLNEEIDFDFTVPAAAESGRLGGQAQRGQSDRKRSSSRVRSPPTSTSRTATGKGARPGPRAASRGPSTSAAASSTAKRPSQAELFGDAKAARRSERQYGDPTRDAGRAEAGAAARRSHQPVQWPTAEEESAGGAPDVPAPSRADIRPADVQHHRAPWQRQDRGTQSNQQWRQNWSNWNWNEGGNWSWTSGGGSDWYSGRGQWGRSWQNWSGSNQGNWGNDQRGRRTR